MPRGSVCRAKGCVSNKNDNPNLTFHSFPRNRERFKQWCELLKRPDLKYSSVLSNRTSMRVCSLHFEQHMYMSPLVTHSRLIWNAMPMSVPGEVTATDSSAADEMEERDSKATAAQIIERLKAGSKVSDYSALSWKAINHPECEQQLYSEEDIIVKEECILENDMDFDMHEDSAMEHAHTDTKEGITNFTHTRTDSSSSEEEDLPQKLQWKREKTKSQNKISDDDSSSLKQTTITTTTTTTDKEDEKRKTTGTTKDKQDNETAMTTATTDEQENETQIYTDRQRQGLESGSNRQVHGSKREDSESSSNRQLKDSESGSDRQGGSNEQLKGSERQDRGLNRQLQGLESGSNRRAQGLDREDSKRGLNTDRPQYDSQMPFHVKKEQQERLDRPDNIPNTDDSEKEKEWRTTNIQLVKAKSPLHRTYSGPIRRQTVKTKDGRMRTFMIINKNSLKNLQAKGLLHPIKKCGSKTIPSTNNLIPSTQCKDIIASLQQQTTTNTHTNNSHTKNNNNNSSSSQTTIHNNSNNNNSSSSKETTHNYSSSSQKFTTNTHTSTHTPNNNNSVVKSSCHYCLPMQRSFNEYRALKNKCTHNSELRVNLKTLRIDNHSNGNPKMAPGNQEMRVDNQEMSLDNQKMTLDDQEVEVDNQKSTFNNHEMEVDYQKLTFCNQDLDVDNQNSQVTNQKSQVSNHTQDLTLTHLTCNNISPKHTSIACNSSGNSSPKHTHIASISSPKAGIHIQISNHSSSNHSCGSSSPKHTDISSTSSSMVSVVPNQTSFYCPQQQQHQLLTLSTYSSAEHTHMHTPTASLSHFNSHIVSQTHTDTPIAHTATHTNAHAHSTSTNKIESRTNSAVTTISTNVSDSIHTNMSDTSTDMSASIHTHMHTKLSSHNIPTTIESKPSKQPLVPLNRGTTTQNASVIKRGVVSLNKPQKGLKVYKRVGQNVRWIALPTVPIKTNTQTHTHILPTITEAQKNTQTPTCILPAVTAAQTNTQTPTCILPTVTAAQTNTQTPTRFLPAITAAQTPTRFLTAAQTNTQTPTRFQPTVTAAQTNTQTPTRFLPTVTAAQTNTRILPAVTTPQNSQAQSNCREMKKRYLKLLTKHRQRYHILMKKYRTLQDKMADYDDTGTPQQIVRDSRRFLSEEHHLFLESQIFLKNKSGTGNRFSRKFMELMIEYYNRSPAGYRFLRTLFTIPSVKTVKKWISQPQDMGETEGNLLMEDLTQGQFNTSTGELTEAKKTDKNRAKDRMNLTSRRELTGANEIVDNKAKDQMNLPSGGELTGAGDTEVNVSKDQIHTRKMSELMSEPLLSKTERNRFSVPSHGKRKCDSSSIDYAWRNVNPCDDSNSSMRNENVGEALKTVESVTTDEKFQKVQNVKIIQKLRKVELELDETERNEEDDDLEDEEEYVSSDEYESDESVIEYMDEEDDEEGEES